MKRSPDGVSVAEDRINRLPGLLQQQFDSPPPQVPADLRQRGLVTTGIGSSEAAARYLAVQLTSLRIPASYLPAASFYTQSRPPSGAYLAVFSQGISPNTGIALARRSEFHSVLLFTSCTPEGQRSAGKEHRAALLEQLRDEGAQLYVHPLENEYEILPRFIGPVCAMFEAARFCHAASPSVFPSPERIPALVKTPPPLPEDLDPMDLVSGLDMAFTNETSLYAQNLPLKLLETLMAPPPVLMDVLTHAHGPFQLGCAHPRTTWVFSSESPDEQELLRRLTPQFKRSGVLQVIRATQPPPFSIFEYEAVLNQLLLQVLNTHPVDLVNWPGKGEDDAGYGISQPGSSFLQSSDT